MKFKVGELVKLKSGGPVMTVSEEYNNSVLCSWFEKRSYYSIEIKRGALKYPGWYHRLIEAIFIK